VSGIPAGGGLRCAIVGEGSLPVLCGDLAVARGHRVVLVASDDPQVRRWAGERGAAACPAAGLRTALAAAGVDYLFSIVNPAILPADVLAMPARGAVNYHDAPLPRYAGLCATSWALLAGETRHAVTWHAMLPEVDAGPVLVQVPVPITPDDTAFTLNARCHTAAVEGFGLLLDGIATGRLRPRPQDPAARTYFGRAHRPRGGGVLRWDRPAAEAVRLVRAMAFGPAPNPLLLPRLVLPDRVLYVRSADPDGHGVDAPPGTVLDAGPAGLLVATAAGAVRVGEVVDHTGEPVDAAALPAAAPGSRLPTLPPDRLAAVERLTDNLAPHEPFWLRRLADPRPALPPTSPGNRPWAGREPSAVPVDVPAGALAALLHAAGGDDPVTALLAVLAGYLARTCPPDGDDPAGGLDVAWSPAALRRELAAAPGIFAEAVPMRLAVDPAAPFRSAYAAVAAERERCARRGTHPRDLVARHPALRAIPALRAGTPLPVAVTTAEPGEPPQACPGAALTLAVTEGTGACTLLHAGVTADEAALAAAQFTALLRGTAAAPDQPPARIRLSEQDGSSRRAAPRTAQPFPALPDVVARQAVDDAGRAAVRDAGGSLDHGGLHAAVGRLVAALGPRPGRRVAVVLPAGRTQVAAVLAVLATGACAVPCDPAEPPDRLAAALRGGGADLVITDRAHAATLPPGAPPVRLVEGTHAATARQPAAVAVPAGAPAFVLRTAGRGEPVTLSHAQVGRAAAAITDHLGLSKTDAVPLWSPAGSAPWLVELLAGLACGGTLLAAGTAGGDLAGALTDATVVTGLPHRVLEWVAEVRDRGDPDAHARLRAVVLTGDRAPRRAVDRVAGVFWGVPVRLGYTACGGGLLCALTGDVTDTPDPDLVAVLPHVALRVTDRYGGEAPDGVLGRVELREWDGGVWNATGDLGRRLPGGAVRLAGRSARRLRWHGHPVPAEDVEDALVRHPAVADAAVVGPDPVAHVAPAPGAALSGRDLRRATALLLPAALLPDEVRVVDAVPRTPAGRVDVPALRRVDDAPLPGWSTQAGRGRRPVR
jgi:methionyl-tRNA formyltransferase/acyl-CoA synthetase (AMP-forming)/AMP-acid ligase II